MDVKKVVETLKQKYPGKKIILNTPNNPREIICEVDPTEEHPKRSMAVAVVDQIHPHFHKLLTEIYEVTKGELIHHNGEKTIIVRVGESVKIPPGTVHWSEGNETWLTVYSTPAWTPQDHILVVDGKKFSQKEFNQRFSK